MLTVHGTFLILRYIIILSWFEERMFNTPGFFSRTQYIRNLMVSENKVKIKPFHSMFQKRKPKTSYGFMIRSNWNFCDQILQAVATLDIKLKNFIFIFLNFNSFSKMLSTLLCHWAMAFQQCQIHFFPNI